MSTFERQKAERCKAAAAQIIMPVDDGYMGYVIKLVIRPS